MIIYKVEFTNKAVRSFLLLPKTIQEKIMFKLELLEKVPFANNNNIKKLHGISDAYRLRVGDYRILYKIHKSLNIIEVVNIAHRKEAYK